MSSIAGPASVSGDIVRSPVPVRLSGSRTDMEPEWGTGSGLTIWTSRYDHKGTIRRVRHSRKLRRRGGPARAQQRATVRDAVRADQHSAAGRGRRGVRPDVGARDLRDTAPRVRGARGSALRTAGGHFSFARLPPARVAHLPRQAHDVDEDQGFERRHRAVRKAPEPNGMPGFLRVDTVHQGDRDGVKGVYIVNLVDEVTQYEYVGVVRGISERFLIPAPEALLLMFPFPVRASTPTTAPSTSTTGWSVSSRSCVSASSRSRARGVPTTTRWSRARTRTWCAGISATSISRPAFPTACSTPQSPKHHLAASRPPRRIEPQPPPSQTRS